MHKHILICGSIGVGKSTLVSRIADAIGKPLYGYKTLSMNKSSDGHHEIYIFSPSDKAEAQLVARASRDECKVYPEVFNTYGVQLLSSAKNDGIILMDEIGFMESNATIFTSKILELLDGEIPIIGAIKSTHPNCVFLNQVRTHDNVELVNITEANRNVLFEKIMERRFY